MVNRSTPKNLFVFGQQCYGASYDSKGSAKQKSSTHIQFKGAVHNLVLSFPPLVSKPRGYSSVGRASALQAECHRFDSGYLHQFHLTWSI